MNRIACLALLACGCLVNNLHGHPSMPNQAISAPTIAQLFVADSEVRLQLEIGKADLPVFADLTTDGVKENPTVAQLRFFSRGWVIEAGEETLRGKVVIVESRHRVKREPVTGEPLPPDGTVGEPVTFVEVRYPLSRKPANIFMKPPKADDGATATIGLVVWHRAIPVCDFDYLKLPTGFRLDWEDPWKSRFRGLRFQRYWNFPVWMNFTVEPRAVRMEVSARPGVAPWAAAKPETLMSQFSLTIDGKAVTPTAEPMKTLQQKLGRIEETANPAGIPPETAFRRYGFVVPVASRPAAVTLKAPFINGKLKEVPVWVNAGDNPQLLTSAENVLEWGNPSGKLDASILTAPPSENPKPRWSVPSFIILIVGSLWIVPGLPPFRSKMRQLSAYLVLVAVVVIVWVIGNGGLFPKATPSPVPDDDGSHQLVHRLLADSYLAFDCRDEEDVYDTLAETISGPLLRETYLGIRRMLESPGELGKARVRSVEVRSAILAPLPDGPGYSARATWVIEVAITHLGHTHNRLTQLEGEMSIRPRQGRWMIASLTVLDQRPATEPAK